MQIFGNNFYCFDHQHGCHVTWLLRPSVSQPPDNNGEFTQQDGRKKRTAKHSCGTNLIGLLLVFCRDLHLTPMFTGRLQNDLFKGK